MTNPWGGDGNDGSKDSQRPSKDEASKEFIKNIREFSKNKSRSKPSGGGFGNGKSDGGDGRPTFNFDNGSFNKFKGWVALNFLLVGVVVLILWGLSGFYRVETSQEGLVLRFGKFIARTSPGLNYHLPYPIEDAVLVNVARLNQTDIGIRTTSSSARYVVASALEITAEGLMLTGDENFVDIDFQITWIIDNPENFVFKISDAEEMVKSLGESTMRAEIGRRNLQPILTAERGLIENNVREKLQNFLKIYNTGVLIQEVKLLNVDPPKQVIDSFRDVQAARADQERLKNQADSYANRVVPEARGDAEKILQQATAIKERMVLDAKGQASRFKSVYEEYSRSKVLTRKRLYIETLEKLFSSSNNIIVEKNVSKSGVLPLINLDK